MSFNYQQLNFPYDSVRKHQDLLIQNINASIEARRSLIAHAPTGLGKTASALAPAITQAIAHDLSVLFLTSRHTQHRIVIDTIRDIKEKYGLKIPVTDLISKQAMCPQEVSNELSNTDFSDYCKDMRENGRCPYYRRTRKVELTAKAESVLNKLLEHSPMHSEELVHECVKNELCPYEVALELGKLSRVVVCDYFHVFSTPIRNSFMNRMNKSLEDSIIIIDEAHNLPDRIRSLMTHKLTTYTINGSVNELLEEEFTEEASIVRLILRSMESLIAYNDKEQVIKRNDFVKNLESLTGRDFDELTSELQTTGESIRELKNKSFTLAIARFLSAWLSSEDNDLRVLKYEYSKRGSKYLTLTNYCLNPASHTKPVFEEAYSSILMSGTLTPTTMYSEILGLDGAGMIELKSPFPEENRLTLVVPETTTKYSRRSSEEYQRIAAKIHEITKDLSVSTAVFFPSYKLLNEISSEFRTLTSKEIVLEEQGLSKEEKNNLLTEFKKNQGAVLMGVISGNFGEGIDLPGSELECIIIVGVPLPVPDLFTKSLINFYDESFGKGWDYGYNYPAITRVIQSAGRCIRQASDKGLIVLLDERYAWKKYLKAIPPEWQLKVTRKPGEIAKEFFT